MQVGVDCLFVLSKNVLHECYRLTKGPVTRIAKGLSLLTHKEAMLAEQALCLSEKSRVWNNFQFLDTYFLRSELFSTLLKTFIIYCIKIYYIREKKIREKKNPTHDRKNSKP